MLRQIQTGADEFELRSVQMLIGFTAMYVCLLIEVILNVFDGNGAINREWC